MSLMLIALGGLLGLAIVGAIAYRLVYGGESDSNEHPVAAPVVVTRNTPKARKKHFFGAMVQPGPYACEAVKKLDGQRFLVGEGPQLPLPDCDARECRCRVAPQDDRRAGYDRRGDSFSAYGDFEPDRYSQKRREPSDRRDS